MKQGLVRLLYNLGKAHGVDITHDNVCSSMLSCFYSHLLSTGRPISSSLYNINVFFQVRMPIFILNQSKPFSEWGIPTFLSWLYLHFAMIKMMYFS